MKFCSNCGNPSEEGKKFCVKCGNSLQTGAEQTANVQQTPEMGYQQVPQGQQGGYQQVPQGQQGGYQQVPQVQQGGYQQVPEVPEVPGYQQVPQGQQGGYQQVPQGQQGGYQQVAEVPEVPGYQQVPQGQQGGYQQVPKGQQGGYQQAPQGQQGGYQQVPQGQQGGYQPGMVAPTKKKSPLLTLGIVGIFAMGALGAAFLLGDGKGEDGGLLSVFQTEPDLEPFPYDLTGLLDQDAILTAIENEDEDYFEDWVAELEEIPEDYYYDLAIGAGSIAAVYFATNLDTVVAEAEEFSDDLQIPTEMVREIKGYSDEIWDCIPSELESLTITWDTSIRAKSGEIPFSLVVNGEEFIPDPKVDEDDLEEMVLNQDPSDWTLDEMLDLLSFFYFVAEEELDYMLEWDGDNEIFDFLYASTSWAKVEPFVLEIERTSGNNFDVYTSSAHWAQLGFSYKNGKASEMLDIAPLIAGVLAPQYLNFVESSRQQTDFSRANELVKGMTIALAVTEGDHAGSSITWRNGSGLDFSNVDSKYANEVQMTLGNFPDYTSEFGQKNPITLMIGQDNGMIYIYVDASCDAQWADTLGLPWGPK